MAEFHGTNAELMDLTGKALLDSQQDGLETQRMDDAIAQADRALAYASDVINHNKQRIINEVAEQFHGIAAVSEPEPGFMVGGLWIPGERRRFHRVIDVGCGPGLYTKAMAEALGTNGMVEGIDPDPMLRFGESYSGFDRSGRGPSWLLHNTSLDEHSKHEPTYDLALCLEVVEHVPVEDSREFVRKLCRLAPVLIFSAAAPGQGGDGHFNCQPKEYWLELFEQFGFALDTEKTDELLSFMREGYHMGWFTQNAMVLTSYGYRNFRTIDDEERPQAERLGAFVAEALPRWLGTGA